MSIHDTELHFREATADDCAAIRAVVFSVLEEYGLSPDPRGIDADLEDVVSSYGGRGGSFRVVVSSDGEIVGCGGLYPLNELDAEIRKMYLVRTARGRGLGRALLEDLIALARERGFARIIVETAAVLEEAISLYRRRGFVPFERDDLAARCDRAYVLHLSRGAADIKTARLELVLHTPEDVRAMIEAMAPAERAELSADWRARFEAAVTADPWVHGFSVRLRQGGMIIGSGGFKGPPAHGVVEIAYGVASTARGKGYATEIAQALCAAAFESTEVRAVRAHTLPDARASQRILEKCGFEHVGEIVDPEDGLVWRFEKRR